MVETNSKQVTRYINKSLLLRAGETAPTHRILTGLLLLTRQWYVHHRVSVNKNDRNLAPQELLPSSFPLQAPRSSYSLHLGSCSPRPSQGQLLPFQISVQRHLLREASLTTPT